MKVINNIMATLSAMGAKPTVTTDENGTTCIKVNAPIVGGGVTLELNEKRYFIPSEHLDELEWTEENK